MIFYCNLIEFLLIFPYISLPTTCQAIVKSNSVQCLSSAREGIGNENSIWISTVCSIFTACCLRIRKPGCASAAKCLPSVFVLRTFWHLWRIVQVRTDTLVLTTSYTLGYPHTQTHTHNRKSLSVTGTEVFHSQFEYACVNVNVNVLVVRLLKEKDTYARSTKEAGAASEAGLAVQRSAIDCYIPCRQLSASRQLHDSRNCFSDCDPISLI